MPRPLLRPARAAFALLAAAAVSLAAVGVSAAGGLTALPRALSALTAETTRAAAPPEAAAPADAAPEDAAGSAADLADDAAPDAGQADDALTGDALTDETAPDRIAPALTAALTAAPADPADPEANPGDVLRYLLTLVNGGADDALDVAFSSVLDVNATLVAGSVRVSPLAAADAYTGAVAASAFTVAAAAGVLANDARGVPLAAVASFGGGTLGGTETTNAAGASAAFGTGGTLTVNADGSLALTAPAGFSGALTFRYRLANSAGADAAEVSISVAVVPTQITVTTQPSATAQSGTAFATQPAVQIRDAAGNAVARAGVVVTVAIASGGGTLGGTATATTSAAGVATFAGLSVSGTPGGRTLSFSSPGLTSATSATVSVSAGVAASLVLSAPPSVLSGTAASVTVTLRDASGNVATGYTGTVRLTSSDATATLPPDATFAAGDAGTKTLALTLRAAGTQTVTATDIAATALTATATVAVTSVPAAVADAPAANSAPGSAYHTAYQTPLAVAAPGVLGNDSRGFPLATVTSFGGGGLGGSVTTNAAGTTATFDGDGQVSVAADGSISFTPSTFQTGPFTFSYRITNSAGTSDATLTLAVGVRPAIAADTYTPVLVGNVPINTALSTGFSVLANDAGSRLIITVTTQTNGSAGVAGDGTVEFAPAAGYTGPASFVYTVSNGFGTTAPATVSFTVGTPVFFVNAAAVPGGDGRRGTPFTCLTGAGCLSATTADDPGDRVYIASGAYTGGLTLLGSQVVVGQGATGTSFASVAGLTWPADSGAQPAIGGTAPTVTTSAAATNGVTLGSGNSLFGLTFGNATGSAILGSAFGTLTVGDLRINTTGQALNLTTGTLAGTFAQVASSGGTNNVLLSGVSGTATLGTSADALSGATSDAVRVAGGAGSFTVPGTVSNTTALAVNVTGTTGGTLAFSGAVNPTTASRGITVSGTSGTTIDFSGAAQKISTATLPGVSLTSNTGSTVRFSGGNLAVATTTGAAFTATGGGTVSVTGAANTLATTTGRTLGVASTTIGTGGLVFRSLASTGGDSGVVLNTTGSTAGLTVTGTGTTAGSGGTILTTAGDAVSLTSTASPSLRYMVLGETAAVLGETRSTVNAVAGAGIAMTGVTNAVFRDLKIARTGSHGISGTGVNGLTVTDTDIFNAGDGVNENALEFAASASNLIGTAALTNVRADGAASRGLRVANTAGTLALTVTGGRFSNTQNLPGDAALDNVGNDGVLLSAAGTAVITAGISSATFAALESDGVQGVTSGTTGAVLNLTALSNTFTGYRVGAAIPAVPAGNRSSDNAVELNATGTTTLKYTVSGNTMTASENQAVLLSNNDASTVDGRVTNNVIDGTASNYGIEGTTVADETASVRLLVDGNTVRNTELEAMTFNSNLTSTLNLTVTNNTVPTRPRNLAATFENIQSRALGTSNLCWNVRANSVALGGDAVAPPSSGGIRLFRPSSNTTNPRLEQAAGGATPLVTLQNNNPAAAATLFATTTIALVPSGTCTLPAATPLTAGATAGRPSDAPAFDAPTPDAPRFDAPASPLAAAAESVAAAVPAPAAAPALAPPAVPTPADAAPATPAPDVPAPAEAVAAAPALAPLTLTSDAGAPAADEALGVEQALAQRAASEAASEATSEAEAVADVTETAAPPAARSGETVTVAVGRLAAGKTVRVLYDATLANPFPAGYAATATGSVTASNAPTIPLTRTTPVRQTLTASRTFAGTAAPNDDAGWRLLAAPVGGLTVATLAGQNLVQGIAGYYPTFGANLLTQFNGTALLPPAGGSDPLPSGAGFFWYFYDRAIAPPGGPSQSVPLPFTLAGTGAGTSGPVAVPLRPASQNMLGNPFTLPLDVSGLAGWATGGTLASFVAQLYDGTGYVLSTTTGNRVGVWQGMFVDAGTATGLVIPPAAQAAAPPLAGDIAAKGADGAETPGDDATASTETRLVAFELRGTTAAGLPTVDRAAVLYFHPDATAEWDGWDAIKLTPPSAEYALLAFEGVRGGSPVLKAQESRPLELAAAFDLALDVDAQGTAGPLTLTWPTLANVPEAWSLVLRDAVTNERVDLRQAASHTFSVAPPRPAPEAPAGTAGVGPLLRAFAPRFVLTVAPRATATEAPAALPAVFALGGAMPNPVRGAARIRIDVPQPATVTVEVFDMLGRLATTVVDGPLTAGRHDLGWQPTGFPSGVYLVRMRARADGGASFTETRRVTVVR